MFSLKFLFAVLAVTSILVTLPTATQCDTSYYEKYYSARRFLPLKKATLLQVNFTVNLENDNVQEFEQLAIVGDIAQLGSWKADKAILMNRTEDASKWQAAVMVPGNITINYRYFIAAKDKTTKTIQIGRWESALRARNFNISSLGVERNDRFGYIAGETKKELQKGWLNSGHLVQFKLFHNPLKLNEPSSSVINGEQRLRVKFTAVDPEWRTPIMPSARANLEYVRMQYGNSFLGKQPDFGVLYGEKDIIMYQATVAQLNNVAYLVETYVEDLEQETARVTGYQYIYPGAIVGTSGEIDVTLLSPTWMNTIGSLKLQYVVLNPLPGAAIDFRTSFVDYWRSNWTGLEAGHRGLGKSLTETTNAAPLMENTIGTMIAAGELGADIVEFDVQLTKDLVAIIHHDFAIWVCMVSKTPTTKDDLTQVLIKDVTYEQLKDLTTYQVISNKVIEFPSHNAIENENQRMFPTFEQFLTRINKTVGFDIEIKWPQLKSNGVWESTQTIDKNLYIDRILDVMMQHGCGRLSFFTSFDADICSMIRYKQNMYPVMFLSSSKEANFADPRSNTIYDSVNTAQAFDYAGIVPNAVFIKSKPEWIKIALAQNKKVFLWGGDLKDRESIDWFLDQEPTGVIYDRMDLYLHANRTSVFEMEPDLPEFFQWQCKPSGQGMPENITATNILSNVNML